MEMNLNARSGWVAEFIAVLLNSTETLAQK
jgi:hypothetical protein